jgi:diacylglycerol kinase (ATP)
MRAPRRVILFANPRSGRAAAGLGPALGAFADAGIAVQREAPDSAAAMAAAIRRRAREFDAIAVAGGDGTVNAAAAAAAETDRPLCILPFGTANDLAHTLGIPINPVAAAGLAIAGFTRRIDLGRVNDQVFLNAASLGLPVTVALHQDPALKRTLKSLSYVVATVKAVRETRRFTVWITIDGSRTELKAIQVTVGNGVRFGGGMRVGAAPAIDDGLLDVFAIEAETLLELVRVAPAIRFGLHEANPHTRTFSGRDVRIETKREMPISTDGEITTTTPGIFSIERNALAVYVPPPATGYA